MVALACAVAKWLLQRDVRHCFDPFRFNDETATFHVIEEASGTLAACVKLLAKRGSASPSAPGMRGTRRGRDRAENVPDLGELVWVPDEAPGLPSRERVDEVWRALGGLRQLVLGLEGDASARAASHARTASDWGEFRALFEIAVAATPDPFHAVPALARELKRKPRVRDLEPTTWEGASTMAFHRVQLNNNSDGIDGRVFPLSPTSPGPNPYALLALWVAEDDLGDEYAEMSPRERLEWLREDTELCSNAWRPLSFYDVLSSLSEMLATNHGRGATERPGEVDLGDARGTSLSAALTSLGSFVAGAASEHVFVLRFERAWWLLRLRL